MHGFGEIERVKMAQRIRKMREDHGISQDNLASELETSFGVHISGETIRCFETDNSTGSN